MDEQEEIKNNIDEHPATKFEDVYKKLQEIRNEINKLQKKEKLLLKKLNNVHNKYVKKIDSKKRKSTNIPTGFNAKRIIGGKLATWLGVEHGTYLCGPEISKLFWQKLKDSDLQSKDDGRIFRTNKLVSTIFGVPMSVNESTEANDINGFNMRTYQTYIKYALDNHNE